MYRIFHFRCYKNKCVKIIISFISIGTINFSTLAQSNSNEWSLILIPDPQNYVKYAGNQQMFYEMIKWIANSKDSLNTKLVLCVGDLVEQNSITNPSGSNGDQTGDEQWAAAKAAWSQLDNKLPYILSTGNHDYGISNAENRTSQFGTHFKPSDNSYIDPVQGGILKGMGKNAFDIETLENAYYEFISPIGRKYLILSLEFAPRDAMIDWGNTVLKNLEYQDHTGILVTHSYLNSEENNNARMGTENYGVYPEANSGQQIWTKLVQPNDNIEMVFSGHVASSENFTGMLGYRTDDNTANKTVHQMMFNAQRIGGWQGNGGDGWLRVLKFTDNDNNVDVITYSTHLKQLREESYDKFSMALETFTDVSEKVDLNKNFISTEMIGENLRLNFSAQVTKYKIHDIRGNHVLTGIPNQNQPTWKRQRNIGVLIISAFNGSKKIGNKIIYSRFRSN